MNRFLIIGVGGLGVPAALHLASEGGCAITVLDPDRVELSNLHRQILYREADVGRAKVDVAADRLTSRFSIEVEAIVGRFGPPMYGLVEHFDVVIDGTDRFETKIAISDACTDRGVRSVFAGVVGHEGQVLAVWPRKSACVRCLFDEAPGPGAAPTCEEVGILGPIAGIVGAEQGRRARALADGDTNVLDTLWTYEGHGDRVRTIALRRADDCRGCGDRRHERGWVDTSVAPSVEHDADAVLDLCDRVCPATYVETNKALQRLDPGGRLWVHLTSDESARNVPASAQAAGYRVIASEFDGHRHRVLIERPERIQI